MTDLDAVRALIAAEPAIGIPAVAERLGITEHAARVALRELGHIGRPGRRPAAAPAPIDPARWLEHDPGMALAAAGEALAIRAERGQGLSAEECREVGRVLLAVAGSGS